MTKKMLKNIFALLLATAMLCGLCACENIPSQKSDQIDEHKNTANNAVAQAQALIDQGEYEQAYALLMDTENDDAVALRNKLVFVPTKTIYSDEQTSRTLTFTYNSDHNTAFFAYGSQYETITCNDDGNVLSKETINSDGDCSTITHTYTYNENNDCVMIKMNNSDGGWTKNTYTHDKYGNVLTNVCTSDSGFELTYAYTYDTNGNQLSEECTSNGNFFQRKICTYDQKGNLLTVESFSNNNMYEKYIFAYDENGYPKSEKYTDEEGNQHTIHIIYDENGKLLREEYSDSNHLLGAYSYIYDGFGNLQTVTLSSESDDNHGTSSIAWELCYFPNGAPNVIQYFSRLAKLNVLGNSYIVRHQTAA
ncbi:MAG: hypothetical protein IJB36_06280 [Clostridia bacterium]|nr:hypothetical protein [Clostridia bacterium]